MNRSIKSCAVCLMTAVTFLINQPVLSDNASPDLSIELSAQVEPNHVPLNGSVKLKVQVMWQGDLNRIEIEEIEEPLLSHLEITGSASANHIIGGAESKAIKEVIYFLKPLTLGMAYIESVVLKYQDTVTGESHFLQTERISIEVLPAVQEKKASGFLFWPIAALVLILGAGIILYLRRSRQQAEPQVQEVILEEAFLDRLHVDDLSKQNPDTAFTHLIKMFRQYLAQKYDIPTMEATTDKWIASLKQTDLGESLTSSCEKLFREADVLKFSGEKISQSALEEAYSTFEQVLKSQLNEALRIQKEKDEAVKKSRHFLKLFSPGTRLTRKNSQDRSVEEDE
jgi:hypothetical protein